MKRVIGSLLLVLMLATCRPSEVTLPTVASPSSMADPQHAGDTFGVLLETADDEQVVGWEDYDTSQPDDPIVPCATLLERGQVIGTGCTYTGNDLSAYSSEIRRGFELIPVIYGHFTGDTVRAFADGRELDVQIGSGGYLVEIPEDASQVTIRTVNSEGEVIDEVVVAQP